VLLMSHSILAADTKAHLKAVATAITLAVSLVVIAFNLASRPSALRGEAQAQSALFRSEVGHGGVVR
jgi:hypothetical protein